MLGKAPLLKTSSVHLAVIACFTILCAHVTKTDASRVRFWHRKQSIAYSLNFSEFGPIEHEIGSTIDGSER